MEKQNTPPKTVADFLREAAIGLGEGDVLSLRVNEAWSSEGQFIIVKPKMGVAVWVMPVDRFWSFWQQVEALKKVLGQEE